MHRVAEGGGVVKAGLGGFAPRRLACGGPRQGRYVAQPGFDDPQASLRTAGPAGLGTLRESTIVEWLVRSWCVVPGAGSRDRHPPRAGRGGVCVGAGGPL